MPKLKFVEVIFPNGKTTKITVSNNKETLGYIEFTRKEVSGRTLIEIDQVFTEPHARGQGVGSQLILKVFAKAIKEENDIRLQIQPGSQGFYQKFFRQFFNIKSLKLLDERPVTLGAKLKDGASIDMAYLQLSTHYKLEEKNRDMERSLKTLTTHRPLR